MILREACEWVWRPTEHGWQKRLSVAISPDRNDKDAAVRCEFSTGMWQGCHDFMFAGPHKTPQYLHLDPYALSVFGIIQRAIEEWLENKELAGEKVERFFCVKAGFSYSDIRRFTHFAMRCQQYLERLHPACEFDERRSGANVFELMAGVHWWLRQLRLHRGFYRFWAKHKASSSAGSRREDSMAEALSGATPPARLAVHLSAEDSIKNALMTNVKFPVGTAANSGDMRVWIQNRFKKEPQLADKVKQAAKELAASGLLGTAEGPKKAGRKVDWYAKKTWVEVQSSEGAMAEVSKLCLQRASFE